MDSDISKYLNLQSPQSHEETATKDRPVEKSLSSEYEMPSPMDVLFEDRKRGKNSDSEKPPSKKSHIKGKYPMQSA